MREITKLLSRGGIATLLCLFALSQNARAFSETSSGTLSQPGGVCVLNLFDPSLGALTAVKFTITGAVDVSLNTPVDLVDSGGNSVAIPYNFTFGLQEAFRGKVSMSTDTQYTLSAEVPPGAAVTDIPISYSYSFELDSETDQLGGLALIGYQYTTASGTAVPAPFAQAKLSDFVGPAGFTVPFQFNDIFFANGITTSTGEPVTLNSISGGASVSVEYDYVTPEPGTIAYLALLLFARPSRSRIGRRNYLAG